VPAVWRQRRSIHGKPLVVRQLGTIADYGGHFKKSVASFLLDSGLTPHRRVAFAVMHVLVSRANNYGVVAKLTRKDIARISGYGLSAVKDALRELEGVGYEKLSKGSNRSGLTNVYRIFLPASQYVRNLQRLDPSVIIDGAVWLEPGTVPDPYMVPDDYDPFGDHEAGDEASPPSEACPLQTDHLGPITRATVEPPATRMTVSISTISLN
jgi:hypothetical protein